MSKVGSIVGGRQVVAVENLLLRGRRLVVAVAVFLLLVFPQNSWAAAKADANVSDNVTACMADPSTIDLIDRIFQLGSDEAQDGIWYIPTDVIDDPSAKNRKIPILGKEGFEWLSNVIPSSYDRSNIQKYPGLPPPPLLQRPKQLLHSILFFHKQKQKPKQPLLQLFPFYNYRWDTANWGHKKFPAFPMWVLAFLGNDPAVAKSENDRNSIFAKNLEDRGGDDDDEDDDGGDSTPHNWLKHQYMSALTCDKIPLYESKIDKSLQDFYQDIVIEKQPVLSSFYNRMFELYLDLHLHTTTTTTTTNTATINTTTEGESVQVDHHHPDYVLEYIQLFTRLLSPGDDDYVQSRRDDVIRGACLQPLVEAYFDERYQYIVDNDIQSTLVYWWDKAGMARESVLFEAVHNILAWGQFVNTLYLVIRAKLQGYLVIENLLKDPVERPFDFFSKFNKAATTATATSTAATTTTMEDPAGSTRSSSSSTSTSTSTGGETRLDVVREIFRMLVPTPFYLSQVERNGRNYNQEKVIEDPNFDRAQSLLIPLFIHVMNDGFSPVKLDTNVAVYDTSRYEDFQPNYKDNHKSNNNSSSSSSHIISGCPYSSPQLLSELGDFGVSSVDGETVIPPNHEKYFPVYRAGERRKLLGNKRIHGPKYCAFGLGYRRCPAELFNTVLMEKVMEKLGNVNFRIDDDDGSFEEPEPGDAGFEDAIPMGLSRASDNIFVD